MDMMNRRVFSFDSPDQFVCGAVGQPGQRTFYLQAAKGERVVSVALEKTQVAVLAERLATLLLALRQGGVAISESSADADTPVLTEPVVEQFRVGTLTIGWDGDAERIVIEARELTDEEDEEDEESDEDEDEPTLIASDLGDGPDLVRVQLEPDAALAFASGAVAVVQAGGRRVRNAEHRSIRPATSARVATATTSRNGYN